MGSTNVADRIANEHSSKSEFIFLFMTARAETISLIGAGLNGPLLALGLDQTRLRRRDL